MDRNQTIGLLLIGLVLLAYMWITKPTEQQLAQQKRIQDSLAQLKQQQDTNKSDTLNISQQISQNNDSTAGDSSIIVQMQKKLGVFANNAIGQKKTFTVENNVIALKFTTQGARIISVRLKNYTTYDKKPLILFDGENNHFNFNFFAKDKLVNTENLIFKTNITDTLVQTQNDTIKISFRATVDSASYLEYVYTIEPNNYLVHLDVNFVNLQDVIPLSTTFLELNWQEYVRHLERGEKMEHQNTLLYYKVYQAGVEKLKPQKHEYQEKTTSKIRWISYKQQFFNSTLIAKNYFEYATMAYKDLPDDTVNLYLMESKIIVPFRVQKNVTIPLAYYFGPNKYSILRKVEVNGEKLQMEKLIPLGKGLTAWINKWFIIPMFNFLGKFINNYGIIILIMTLVIKLLLFPLTYKTYASSAKTRIIKPELDKILKKIPEDKQMERQQATMNFYRKVGINPMGGCLPMLLQFPILIAMYRFFPASIELRQKSFLWVKDLSTYDAIVSWHGNIPVLNWIFGHHISLFTLLMAITMLLNSLLNSQNYDNSNPQAKTMKWMMYFFPLMMIIWFNNYSAGLSYYYFLASLIGIIQIYTVRAMIDEDKVLAQVKERLKNPKAAKKSKWQQRLEQMQKQQEQMKKYRKK